MKISLADIERVFIVGAALFAMLTALFSVGGVWMLLGYRMKRAEEILFGSLGKIGLVERIEKMRIICAANHRHQPSVTPDPD